MAKIIRSTNNLKLQGEFKINPQRKNNYAFTLDNGDSGEVKITKKMRIKIFSEDKILLSKAKIQCDELFNFNGEKTSENPSGAQYLATKKAGLSRRSIYNAISRNDATAHAFIAHKTDEDISPDSDKLYFENILNGDYKMINFHIAINNEKDRFHEKFGWGLRIDTDPDSYWYQTWDIPGNEFSLNNCSD